MKVLVTILGGASTGKSTLGRALLGANPVESRYGAMIRVGCTVNVPFVHGAKGWSIVGNIGSGTDVISSTAARQDLTNYLLDSSEENAKYIIVNSVRSSGLVDVDWPRVNPRKFACLYVYLDLSEEECLCRLAARRTGNGKTGPLTETNIRNAKAFLRRARNVYTYLRKNATKDGTLWDTAKFGKPGAIALLYDPDNVDFSVTLVQQEARRLERLK